MRTPIILLLLATCCWSCVSSGKYKRSQAAFNDQLVAKNTVIGAQSDSIVHLLRELERARGANDALLLTQDKFQDRLLAQDDELETLRGNLSSTSQSLQRELADTRRDMAAQRAGFDSVLVVQQAAVLDFQQTMDVVSNLLADSLARHYGAGDYGLSNRAGEVTLSVQEEVLFRRGEVGRLQPSTAPLLRAAALAMLSDPRLKLVIVGHTDNQPNPRRNTNNWEYGALRATALAATLAGEYNISPNRLSAASQGEFSPTRSNSTEEGRRANRRVDFVFTNNVGNLLRSLKKLLPEGGE